MTVWVDADSCPVRVREIVARAAARRGVAAVFVANRKIPVPKNRQVSTVLVSSGEDSADTHIAERAAPGDLVITRDIPLAAELVEKGVPVINDRGEVFSRENVRQRLSVRNFMKELREAGLFESPSGEFGEREVRLFSAAFDRELTKLQKAGRSPQ